MAYVHGSVNVMSKVYLANERRYNYTTPKSFLELVSGRQLLLRLRIYYMYFHNIISCHRMYVHVFQTCTHKHTHM